MGYSDLVEQRRQVGERMATRRQELGLTQSELGKRVGRGESWVSQVERGVRATDRVSVRERLAAALEMPLDKLFPPSQGLTRRELLSPKRDVPPVELRGAVSAAAGRILMVRLDVPLERFLPTGTMVTVTLQEEIADDDH